MHNLTATVAVLRDAETIVRSRLITDREERLLLAELMGQLPLDMLPAHAQLIINAIGRYNARPRKGPFDAEKAARPTEGKQDATPVATGPGTAAEAAQARPSEGQQEQAQDAGVVADASADGGASTKAPAKAEKPKPSAPRK